MARGFGKAPRALSARRYFISSFLTVSKRLSIDEFPSVTGPHGSHAFGNAVIKRGFGFDQEDGEAGVEAYHVEHVFVAPALQKLPAHGSCFFLCMHGQIRRCRFRRRTSRDRVPCWFGYRGREEWILQGPMGVTSSEAAGAVENAGARGCGP